MFGHNCLSYNELAVFVRIDVSRHKRERFGGKLQNQKLPRFSLDFGGDKGSMRRYTDGA